MKTAWANDNVGAALSGQDSTEVITAETSSILGSFILEEGTHA